jgi:ribosomal protein L18E
LAPVHCPRCGTPNEPGDRYCSSCGATLKASTDPGEPVSPRERLGRLVGTTRKARLITAATVFAVLVAVAAFIALEPAEDEIPRDAYTVAGDRLCLDSKRSIVVIERSFAAQGPGAVARELVPVIAAWRSQLNELNAPADRKDLARELEAALLQAEIQIAGLARIAKGGETRQIVAKAREADAASSEVEEAVAALGLSECAEAAIGLAPNAR